MAKTVIRNGESYYMYTCSFCDHEILAKKGEKDDIQYCPHCQTASQWLLKPKTERVLFELQEEYLNKIDQDLFELYAVEIKKPRSEQNQDIINRHLSNMDQKILGEMYLIVQNYVGSLLKKYIKKKAFFLPYEEFDDKVFEITYRWYSQFTKKPNFKIKNSWAGQLKWKIIEVLYDESYVQEGQSLSLDYVPFDSDEKRNFLDKHDLAIANPFNLSINLSTELRKVLQQIINRMNVLSKHDTILTLLAFLFFLQADNRKEKLVYEYYGNNIRDNNEKVKIAIRKYLRNINE